MNEITAGELIAMFGAIAETIDREKDRLCELDGVIGDADHGVTMDIGFKAVVKALAQLDPAATDPVTVFSTAAKSFLNAVGASSGPLYATAFLRAAGAVKGKAVLDDGAMIDAVVAMAHGIKERGKADRGDKTMVDAWLPAAETLEAMKAEGAKLSACFAAAAAASAEGAESTKTMRASKGRASRLGDRAVGHIDPGAASAAMILRTIADRFSSKD